MRFGQLSAWEPSTLCVVICSVRSEVSQVNIVDTLVAKFYLFDFQRNNLRLLGVCFTYVKFHCE